MAKSFLCRIGWHKWRTEVNDSGERYKTCRRCRKVDTGPGVPPPIGAGGSETAQPDPPVMTAGGGAWLCGHKVRSGSDGYRCVATPFDQKALPVLRRLRRPAAATLGAVLLIPALAAC